MQMSWRATHKKQNRTEYMAIMNETICHKGNKDNNLNATHRMYKWMIVFVVDWNDFSLFFSQSPFCLTVAKEPETKTNLFHTDTSNLSIDTKAW